MANLFVIIYSAAIMMNIIAPCAESSTFLIIRNSDFYYERLIF